MTNREAEEFNFDGGTGQVGQGVALQHVAEKITKANQQAAAPPPTPDQALVEDDRRGRREWVTPLIGLILLAILLLTAPIYGRLTSGDKINEAIDRNAERVDVLVDLPFEPETFHREELSSLGVFSGRDRSDPTRIRLRAVTQDNLEAIANLFWVEEILPNQ